MQFYRITKYNPAFRDKEGRYVNEEWTSVYDIGKKFNNKILTPDDYLFSENQYISILLKIIKDVKIPYLVIKELEQDLLEVEIKKKKLSEIGINGSIYDNLPFRNNKKIEIICFDEIFKLILREIIWCKLEFKKKFFIHFGYDFYVYVGCNSKIDFNNNFLFLESIKSPYLT